MSQIKRSEYVEEGWSLVSCSQEKYKERIACTKIAFTNEPSIIIFGIAKTTFHSKNPKKVTEI